MSKLIINGGNKLNGTVKISGAKNSVLPILVSCVITNSICVIENCPNLSDVHNTIKILKKLGCTVNLEKDVITVDSRFINSNVINGSDSREMRSSIVFLSALLSRMNGVKMSSPGGCVLGKRPIDLHISSLRRMGAEIEFKDGEIIGRVTKNLNGESIFLGSKSVGATESIMIAAVLARGTTYIKNAAKEPEIVDLANFLISCGAKIKGAGTSIIKIVGVYKLHDTVYKVMPDRIETITYMALTAVCGGDLILKNTNYKDINNICEKFTNIGCDLSIYDDMINISCKNRLKPLKYLKTEVYPGFPTDAQSIFVSMMAVADGFTEIEETVFENRFRYVKEMNKFGTSIEVDGVKAKIFGTDLLKPAKVFATDLRGGASLVILACSIDGESVIEDCYHIDRGYSNFIDNLNNIGVSIKKGI